MLIIVWWSVFPSTILQDEKKIYLIDIFAVINKAFPEMQTFVHQLHFWILCVEHKNLQLVKNLNQTYWTANNS